ncbi:fused MFS/spermidine synthase [Amphritea sp. 1_MG-2023]|uniref:fused MFS/spermidine synthase n=1 Tax=Amphritea sp. 1_MG-2023 TaxID=3062670 RepID=UPI0026E154A2|nr:fused MFS/spermidine synthase [Amphritea sp. 1_MG-2023]MDO6564558.1 fused MFS/spermidine synthase [Amphritea sp. 1_MG-2023]
MQGTEITRLVDEYGPIYVYDDGPYRYMSFGEGGEQSRIDRSRPEYPVYQYLQVMLLGLLYQPAPQHALMLGLGGGSLIHALLSYSEALQIHVAELRPQVLNTAVSHFQLPDTHRLTISISDAMDYLCQSSTTADLIFTDLFSDAGMQQQQLQQEYLEQCYRLLSDQGVLVLNLWDEGHGYHPRANQQLSNLFGDNWLCCTVDSGNLIAFGFKGGKPESNPRTLLNSAKRLEKRLGFPARKLLNRIRER